MNGVQVISRLLDDGRRLELLPLLYGFRLGLAEAGDRLGYVEEW